MGINKFNRLENIELEIKQINKDLARIDSIVRYTKKHTESNWLNVTGYTMTVVFGTLFSNKPIGKEPDVYCIEPFGDGWRKQQLNWVFSSDDMPTISGFEIKIDSTENITGAILEYFYI
jgi:hypothetical protein